MKADALYHYYQASSPGKPILRSTGLMADSQRNALLSSKFSLCAGVLLP